MICSDKQRDSCETCIHNAVCVMKPDILELRKRCDEIADQIALPYRSLFPVIVHCELYMDHRAPKRVAEAFLRAPLPNTKPAK